MDEDWQADLERWLAPYLEALGNKTRRRMCPAYIAGLIGPGDRKSIQPMAARSHAISYAGFIISSGPVCGTAPRWKRPCEARRMNWSVAMEPG